MPDHEDRDLEDLDFIDPSDLADSKDEVVDSSSEIWISGAAFLYSVYMLSGRSGLRVVVGVDLV